MVETCEICEAPGLLVCAHCMNAFYCTKEHQLHHWELQHMSNCRPFTISRDEETGRKFAVLTRPFEEGELMYKESCIAMAPCEEGGSDNGNTVCVGCLKKFNFDHGKRCPTCKWTLCSEKCKDEARHKPECTTFLHSKEDMKSLQFMEYQFMDLILAIRCMFYKGSGSIWKKLMQLELPFEHERTNPMARQFLGYAQRIRAEFKLQQEFREEEMWRVFAVISAYGYKQTIDDVTWKAVYEYNYVMEHSCQPNVCRVMTVDGTLQFIAVRAVERGDRLTICDVDPFLMGPLRQKGLLERRNFQCSCNRCTDVTEFGTNYSLFKCDRKPCEGLLAPQGFADRSRPWNCNTCRNVKAGTYIAETCRAFQFHYITALRGDLRRFLDLQGDFLHGTHFFMIKAKLELVQRMRNHCDMSEDDLHFKIDLAREVVAIIELLMPAHKRDKNSILFHLQEALDELFIRNKAKGLPVPVLRDILEERRNTLIEILLLREFESSRMYKIAARHLELTEVSLRNEV